MIRTEYGQFATGVEEKTYHFIGYVRKQKFGEQSMVIEALSCRGPLPLMKAPQNVMRNVKRYIRNVLSPWLKNKFQNCIWGRRRKFKFLILPFGQENIAVCHIRKIKSRCRTQK
jgi:macrodomain Ter protein organizer (MatP/YcbG family)